MEVRRLAFTKWDHRFMEMTDTIAGWASCYQQNRKMGAVIVLQWRTAGSQALRRARRVPAAQAGHPFGDARRSVLCGTRRAKRADSGGAHGRVGLWCHYVCHLKALYHLRAAHHQCGHCARDLPLRLSRRVFKRNVEGGWSRTG